MTDTTPPVDENKLIAERRAKLERQRGHGQAFPNDFRRDALAEQLHVAYGERPAEWFDANPDKANSSLRELEPLVGVGRDTLSRARRQWIQMRAGQTEGFSSNGTGE